jgi:hypothetical protein
MPMYPTNKSSSVTQNMKTYTLKPHVIPHQSCANVLVLEQIKHVNSQMPKVSNKLKNPTLDHVFKNFKLTNEYQIIILRSTKNFKTNMNMQFFFFYQKQKLGPSVCKCVPHTPKLKLHIVPNVCITWKDLTREMDETVRNRFDSKHSPQT